MSRRKDIVRIFLVSAVMLAVMAGLGVRLAFLHLGENPKLRKKVQSIRHVEKPIIIGRGRIMERNGGILAINLPARHVCVNPSRTIAAGQLSFVTAHLVRLLDLDHSRIYPRLNKPHMKEVFVKRYVDMETVEQLKRMKLPGVFFKEATARRYPLGSLLCHVTGFSNWAGVGSAGIEQDLNSLLMGREGLMISQRNGVAKEVYGRRSLDLAAKPGADVVLTIDQNVQFMAEAALDRAMEEHNPKGAWVLVQRIRTGEILAMASRPGYDPNDFRVSTSEQRRNRALSYTYEPGSTFKLVVIAAALDEGVVSPGTEFDCENGRWRYNGRSLSDYHGYGTLSVQDIIKKSSNIGAAKIALKLGEPKLDEYIRSFGFGSKLNIDLPGEETGIFHPRRKWSKISATRIAMGHEIAVTGLQMLNAVCAIANDGFLMRPYVVDKIIDSNGKVLHRGEPEVAGRPIGRKAAKTMCSIMTGVTQQDGTGRRARIEGYAVAGKTGTAQKPVAGGYSDSANIASFVGFLPADNPEIGMIVVVDEPQPLHTGGAVAAPVFKEIAEQAVRYLDIPPSERVYGNVRRKQQSS